MFAAFGAFLIAYESALHARLGHDYAAEHLAYGVVDFLLEQDGIDPTIRDDMGRTADFMPLQVYRSQGKKMFEKLTPHCHSSNSEGEYIDPEL